MSPRLVIITHAAGHTGGLVVSLLRNLADERLGGEHQAGDRSRVLKRDTRDLGRVDDAGIDHVDESLALGVEALVGLELLDLNDDDGALEEPLRQIVNNAGLEGSVVVNQVKELETAKGFDAQSETFVNMVKAGIIDPTKVARVALQNAASIAGLMLTTEALVSEVPEKREAQASGMPGGMGGEY